MIKKSEISYTTICRDSLKISQPTPRLWHLVSSINDHWIDYSVLAFTDGDDRRNDVIDVGARTKTASSPRQVQAANDKGLEERLANARKNAKQYVIKSGVRLGREGDELGRRGSGAVATTSATLSSRRPRQRLTSGPHLRWIVARPLTQAVLAAETATRERERGREQRAPATEKKFVLGSPKETTVITQGPAIEVNPFLRWTRAEDSARTIHRVHVFADRVCFANDQMSRNRGNEKEVIEGRCIVERWMLDFCWTSNFMTIRK